MTGIFGATYAGAYDALYRAKDYEREVDLIERLLAQGGKTGPLRILDLGCGTGNHAIPLARRGHRVVGVDQSASMLARARAKADYLAFDRAPVFLQGDLRDADAGGTFDAVLMMFAVLGYMPEDRDVRAASATVRRHLVPGGLFIFDVWYGPAVLADRPGERSVEVEDGPATIRRRTTSHLDTERDLCTVTFDLTRRDGSADSGTVETHTMRYFFPDTLGDLLQGSNLTLGSLRDFLDDARPASESTWNIVGTARAV